MIKLTEAHHAMCMEVTRALGLKMGDKVRQGILDSLHAGEDVKSVQYDPRIITAHLYLTNGKRLSVTAD